LANDRVIELTVAFLNSFRRYNPDIPLCLIPYDVETEQLRKLGSEYNFGLFTDDGILARCDSLSRHFFGHSVGHFRKLAMWEGDYDEFVYIDVDTVVLENLEFGFQFLDQYDFIASHSNITAIRKWVWKETIYSTGALTDAQIEFSANTGFLISKVGALSVHNAETALPTASALAPHMVLFCAEQPFLNYLIVTSGKRYTSLSVIARESGRRDIPLERWGGSWLGWPYQGRLKRYPSEPPTLLVHWAGEWHHGAHENDLLWRYYRDLRAHGDGNARGELFSPACLQG
jgi:hypothetical protein